MKGLLKSNLYASLSNMKLFSFIFILIGIIAAALGKALPPLLTRYSLLCIMGFSLIAIGGIQKENASKWGKYKLTVPVKRMDIVKSYYISHVIWLLIGVFLAAFFIALSVCLHGFTFDKRTDIPMIFTAGISIALLIGAIFFPIFYAGGSERYEAAWTISIFCGIGIFLGITGIVNFLFGAMTDFQLIMVDIFLIAVSVCLFVLSFFLSVGIFRRKEY